MDFICYDNEKEFLKPIEAKIQECLNNTQDQKHQMENQPDFANDDIPSAATAK